MSTTRPILFATDGSPSASEAQREALELAAALGAPLLVVSVSHPALPAIGYTAYGYGDVVAALTEAEHKRLTALLATVEDAARAADIPCSTVTCDGLVVDEICRIAAERNARLLVVGSHGWGATRRLLSGSVSTGLVHSAPCPVLVVRCADDVRERAAA